MSAWQINFYGAADGVTGSRHRVSRGNPPVLLDCGLFQGVKAARLMRAFA